MGWRSKPIRRAVNSMNLALACFGGAGVAYAVYRHFEFYERLDETLRCLHETRPEVWEALGKPVGRLWRPEGVSAFGLPDAADWLNWPEEEPPEWFPALESDLRSKVDMLRRSGRALPLAAGLFVVGGGFMLLGLALG